MGNTPLMLATKLVKLRPQIIDIVHLLFQFGAKPKIKDRSGWRVIDEAIVQQNPNLLVLIFDWMTAMKK